VNTTTLQVYGFHQKIIVDTPNGKYGQSFGMTENSEMQGIVESYKVSPKLNQSGSGIVYQDDDPVIKYKKYFKTSSSEDKIILDYLKVQIGNTGPYNVLSNSCRDYSGNEFEKVTKMISEYRENKKK
jgi:hypothetical protein